MHIISPCEYLAQFHLLESQLVNIFLVETRPSTLVIDVLYAADVLSAYAEYLQCGGDARAYKVETADFRRLRFRSLHNFQVIPDERVTLHTNDSAESFRILRGKQRLVTNAECRHVDRQYRLNISFDSFGKLSWECEEFSFTHRLAIIDRTDDTILYRDAETGDQLDPESPFETEAENVQNKSVNRSGEVGPN